MDPSIKALWEAFAIAGAEPRRAVEILEMGLQRARAESDLRGIGSLAKHAGALCDHLESIHEACVYDEEASRAEPHHLYPRIAWGDALRKCGDKWRAREVLLSCLEMARQDGDEDVQHITAQILEKIE
jgi:hypothetical protein